MLEVIRELCEFDIVGLLLQGQCPCTGGRSNPLLLLAMVAGVWLLATWIRSIVQKEGVPYMNKIGKIAVVIILIVAAVVLIVIKQRSGPTTNPEAPGQQVPEEFKPENLTGKGLPALIDVGAGTCIPCKLMAPILEELKKELQGKLVVQFLDMNKYPGLQQEYRISVMPTQIFYDATGKELFRHEGFFSKQDILAKWKALSQLPIFERLVPAKPDQRPKENVCYMCDADIESKTLATVQTDKGPVRLCSLHCYFIMYSCLTEDKTGFEKKVSVSDWSTGNLIPAVSATYLCAFDQKGRPVVKAFADKEQGQIEQKTSGGNIVTWTLLQEKELAARCGFCDRAVYPEDAAVVRVAGVYTWGCCSHCAMGVAARTGLDIEVHEHDRLTGEPIVVKTFSGSVASIDQAAAVAWIGSRCLPLAPRGSQSATQGSRTSDARPRILA